MNKINNDTWNCIERAFSFNALTHAMIAYIFGITEAEVDRIYQEAKDEYLAELASE